MLTAYRAAGVICGHIAFVAVWIMAIGHSGWVVGIALGWIPAVLAAIIVAIIGPALLLIAILVFAWILARDAGWVH